MISREEWLEYFEMIHDRKPTVSEMKTAEVMREFISDEEIQQIQMAQLLEEAEEAERSKVSKISRKSVSALKKGSKWTFGFLLRTLLRLIMTPFVVTSFFFNFIKSCFIIPIVWCVFKSIYAFALLMLFYGVFKIDMYETGWTRPFWAWCVGNMNEVSPFAENGFSLFFFPNGNIDAVILIVLITLSALLLTHTTFSSKYHYD